MDKDKPGSGSGQAGNDGSRGAPPSGTPGHIFLFLHAPRHFEHALRYKQRNRHLGLYQDWMLDCWIVTDGAHIDVAFNDPWCLLACSARAISVLAPFHFGTSGCHARHMLLFDRHVRRFTVIPYEDGERFLQTHAGERLASLPA